MAKANAATETAETDEKAPELSLDGLNVVIGEEPPKSMFKRAGGQGRTRKPSVFDPYIEQYYEEGKEGKWARVETTDENGNYHKELAKSVEAEIRRTVQYAGYGLELRHNEDDTSRTIGVWFKVGDKSNRGRPQGVKKNPLTGKFEMPIGEDDDGNPIFDNSEVDTEN